MKRRSNGGTVGTGTDGIDRGTAELAGALERARDCRRNSGICWSDGTREGLSEEQRNLLERWDAQGIVGGTAELAGALERAGLSEEQRNLLERWNARD